jgi:hypothetical protein
MTVEKTRNCETGAFVKPEVIIVVSRLSWSEWKRSADGCQSGMSALRSEVPHFVKLDPLRIRLGLEWLESRARQNSADAFWNMFEGDDFFFLSYTNTRELARSLRTPVAPHAHGR